MKPKILKQKYYNISSFLLYWLTGVDRGMSYYIEPH